MRSLEGSNEMLRIKHLAHHKCPMMVMVVVVSLMINIRLQAGEVNRRCTGQGCAFGFCEYVLSS